MVDPDDCYSSFDGLKDTPTPPTPVPPGDFPIPQGFTRVGSFNTDFVFWDKFVGSYTAGTGPSLRWDNTSMTKRDMLVGYEFRLGPRIGTRGDDMITIKFPRCIIPGGARGNYIAHIEWHTDGSNSEGGVGAEWPHPVTTYHDFITDNPTVTIGDIKDGLWHGFLAACYNNSAGNVVIKVWYNATASSDIADYVYLGSSIDVNGQIDPAPKLAFGTADTTGGTHPLQIRIDEIPSNDSSTGPSVYPSNNFELRKMFACEIREGAAPSSLISYICPDGQHYDSLQHVCVLNSGSKGTTIDGIKIPSLPYDSYTLDEISNIVHSMHKMNGSFREMFTNNMQLMMDMGIELTPEHMAMPMERDLNSVVLGGYVLCDGPDDEEITCKLGGGTHNTTDGGKSGRCYEINIPLDGKSINIQKENPHGIYHDTLISNILNLGPRQNKYTGVIFMKCNINWNGKDCVKLQAWVDIEGMSDTGVFTPSKQNWVQVLDATDTGHWHDKPWLTGAIPGNSIAMIRVDQQEMETYDFKFGFCARIGGGPASY